MASNSETGHAKNVANLGLLNAELTQMGALYDPANPDISLTALLAKKTACDLKMTAVTNGTVPYKNAVNARDADYKEMDAKATKIINALAGSGAKADIIKDARGIVNKIQGRRTGPKPEPDPNNPDWDPKSVSQQSFDMRKANFELLVALVKGEPKYNPNESELKVTELENYVSHLGTLNTDVNNTLSFLQQKKLERNEELYGPVFGISDLTGTVKKYVKSAVGASSPVYKRIAGIKFTGLKK